MTAVVVLTIGIASASRIATDVKLSTQIQESGQAFYAAEAGIENGLTINYSGSSTESCDLPVSFFNNTAEADCTVTFIGTNGDPFSLGNISLGESRTVWMIAHNATGNLPADIPSAAKYTGDIDISWVPAGETIEIVVVYLDDGNYLIDRIVVGGGLTAIQSANYIDMANPDDGWILARIRPTVRSVEVTIDPSANMPNQGKEIDSIGKSRSGAIGSGVTRRIIYTKLYPSLPAIFDYVIFSKGDLVK